MDGSLSFDGGNGDTDGSVFLDAGVGEIDGGSSSDGGVVIGDAGQGCEACVSDSPCVTAACVGSACVFTPLAEGASCGALPGATCVAGTCVPSTCGDGIYDPLVESCDDTFSDQFDGCDDACEATESRPYEDSAGVLGTYATVTAQNVGVDASGRALAVYRRSDGSDEDVVATRLDRFGAPLDASPLTIDSALGLPPTEADPTVVGLDTGWAVAWVSTRDGSHDIFFRVVETDGRLGPVVVANRQRVGTQRDPEIARIDGGFVIGWTDLHAISGDPGSGVVARVFYRSGVGRTLDLRLATDRSGDEGQLALAASGTRWLAAWESAQPMSPYQPNLRMRWFDGTEPTDASERVVPLPVADVVDVTVTSDGGRYGLTCRDLSVDGYGDVVMATMSVDEDPTGFLQVSAGPSYREALPSISADPHGHFVVTWEDGPLGRLRYSVVGAPLSSTTAGFRLQTLMSDYAVGSVSVAPGPDGMWFSFDQDAPQRISDVFTVFHLPVP